MGQQTAYRNLRTICITCYSKLSARELRQKAVDSLGSHCSRCGFDDPRALQIDHKKGGGSKERRKLGASTIYRLVLKNPDQFQLLCANCNWIKRAEDKERSAICNHDVEFGFSDP